MSRSPSICLAVLLAAISLGKAIASPLRTYSLAQLEQRREAIDSELAQLAQYSLRTGIGAVGYRSDAHESPDHTEWIQIDLGGPLPIDEVVLVPAIWRDAESGFRADGFPLDFRVLAGTDQSTNALAAYSATNNLLPRIAPLVVPCSTTASWVRVEATKLSARAFDGLCNLDLSEIMVFSGEDNVALRRPVHISAHGHPESGARRREFLVDGFGPYLMDAAQGDQSIAFFAGDVEADTPSFTIDLGTTHNIKRIHLHSVELTDTIPQSTPTDFAMPRHLVIEGADRPNFSDARNLAEHRVESIFDVGPIIMLNVPETTCRYIRLTAVEPYIEMEEDVSKTHIGFAEIEIFSADTGSPNVALDRPVLTDLKPDNVARPLTSLTDGRNLYGTILPIRQWLTQLARRHDLEAERPFVVKELNRRYARQKQNLRILMVLTALFAAGIAFTILIDRMLRTREITRIRQRFAADLHDELGANLHTIGLLSDLAEESRNSPEELALLHQKIRRVTERTGTAMRHCTDLLEAGQLYTGLLADMQRAADRIMAKFDHEITVEGKDHLLHLKPRTRADIFLFYKECLANISRHSGAIRVSTRLTATSRKIQLTVHDNGSGIHDGIPSSLKRRARLLGAKVAVDTPAEGGTSITLALRPPRRLFSKPNGSIDEVSL